MTYSSEVLADSPLAYYRLGDAAASATMTDSSGNARHGAWGSGAASASSLLLSDAGNAAAALNGSGSSAGAVPAAAWMAPLSAISLEAWFKTTGSGSHAIVGRTAAGAFGGPGAGTYRIWLNAGQLIFQIFDSSHNPLASLTAGAGLADGADHHAVGAWDGSMAYLFCDGVQIDSAATTGTMAPLGTLPLNIGTMDGAITATATVDEVAVYGTALSSARVAAHYAAGTSAPSSASMSLAGTLRSKSAAITLDGGVATSALSLSASLRAKSAAFAVGAVSLDGAASVGLAATLQPRVATFGTRAVTPVAPAPPAVIAGRSTGVDGRAVVVAQAFGAVTMQGTQPVYAISEASAPRARQQIVIDGVDFTYFRDVATPDVTYTLLEPLLYGPGNLTLPQVSACFERPGHGDLTPLRPGAVVEVNRVIDDVVVGTDYKGVIVAFDLSGRSLSVELGGEASGRAALRNRQAVLFPRVNDLGHQMADTVSDLGLPFYPNFGPVTGIEAMTFGGMGHLEHIQELVAKAWTRGGGHWTVMPDEATGVYEAHQKDETTIHATAFIDDARTVANLRRDISEEPNRIYATGVTPQGQRVRFGVYPGLNQGPTPDYPGLLQNGDTGEGVRLLIGKLHAVGYLRLHDVAGGFDVDVVEAVKDLQDDAGLPKTGEVDIVTWQALYDLNITGTSLEAAHIEPAAQRSIVRRWDRSGSGQIMGYNDDYDPERLVRDRNVDMGVGLNRSQMRRFARAALYDSNDPNWVGDIVFNTGALLRGNVAVGATVTEADVMDSRELRPGMNVWLPLFDGGTLVHVAACEVGETVKASVDTRFRDAMEVWEVIARNKESRNDPARKRNRAHRASTIHKDSIGEWDEIGGQIGHDVELEAGWNIIETVAAMEGTIARFRLELENEAEFACAVFGAKVDVGFMNDVIGNPLTTAGEKNWRRSAPRARLRDHWLLYSAGTPDEPCGYGEDLKTDDAPLTGVHRDEAGFAYRSEDRTKLYVAVWVEEANTIPLGRIMWPQLEAGV